MNLRATPAVQCESIPHPFLRERHVRHPQSPFAMPGTGASRAHRRGTARRRCTGGKSFTGFSAQVQGPDEIGIFPQHGAALAKAPESGARATMKSPVSDNFEFPGTSA